MTLKHLEILQQKACQSVCRYKISALGINKKGEVVGVSSNKPRFNRHHGGLHAEAELIRKYGSKIKTIIICRVNQNGGLLPIKPCVACDKLSKKMGIKIVSIDY